MEGVERVRWLIAVPAWGDRCIDLFLGPGLDSHEAALRETDAEVSYLIHTDRPHAVTSVVKSKTGRPVVCRLAPGVSNYHTFGLCGAEALSIASMGCAVAMLNADHVVSREFFAASESRFAQGKKVIVTAGTRTLPRTSVPIGASSAELLSWALDNQHPVIDELYWGTGKSRLPSLIYFRDGDAVAMRGFHLGPVALLKDRELKHTKTSDWDLALCYAEHERHIVTGADELSIAEISPKDKLLPVGATPFDLGVIVEWARRKTLPLHRWFFGHRITLRGNGRFGDGALAADLAAALR